MKNYTHKLVLTINYFSALKGEVVVYKASSRSQELPLINSEVAHFPVGGITRPAKFKRNMGQLFFESVWFWL